MEIVGMLRLSGRRVPFCFGKNRVRRAAAVQTVQNRLPRACGEKPVLSTMLRAASGSPPRVRGEAGVEHDVARGLGIIPAHAGRSNKYYCHLYYGEDHPRVCGEKSALRYLYLPKEGSPPRARGEGGFDKLSGIPDRITPACAGRSARCTATVGAREDHPRVCGEKSRTTNPPSKSRGSPPRVRGEASSPGFARAPCRITPACAGRRIHKKGGEVNATDHPRVCGEKTRCPSSSASDMGSPPRVRGEERQKKQPVQPSGITPACAGRSLRLSWSTRALWDHPRVCGEKLTTSSGRRPLIGSPPRVRGEDHPFFYPSGSMRITPACAGRRICSLR